MRCASACLVALAIAVPAFAQARKPAARKPAAVPPAAVKKAPAAATKKIAPEIRLSALYLGTPRDFVDIGKEAGAQIVSPEYPLVTPQQVKAAHAAGFKVLPWTANTPEDWARLVAAGVDGIISDDPAALIAYLKKR